MLEKFKLSTLKIILLIACLLIGFCFANICKTNKNTTHIYIQALKDYNNEDYSNSYYLFSKISRFSKLKPAALYRQAMCAKKLNDSQSELNAYKNIIKYFPTNKLAQDAKYYAGLMLIRSNPQKAQKYFKNVANSKMPKDFKYAANALSAEINIKKTNNLNDNDKKALWDYIKVYPDGKFATQFAKNITKYEKNIEPQEYVLLAKPFYYAKLYEECDKILNSSNLKYSWAINALNASAQNNNNKALIFLQNGVEQYPDFISSTDYKKTINEIMQKQHEYYPLLNNLSKFAKGNNRQYLLELKCSYAPQKQKFDCYKNLYKNFPNSEEATANLAILSVVNKDYKNAKAICDKFIAQFEKSEYIPMILFWRGKIEQKIIPQKADIYFKEIINNYPDNYYAYRAFWAMNNIKYDAIKTIRIKNKEIEFPDKKHTCDQTVHYLLKVGDYDILGKYLNDDFVKSWIEYKKGNITTSVFLAQKAMNDTKMKPPKNDVRWRLVYPLHYYQNISKYSNMLGNNQELILSIIREESHFNPNAGSQVGALGLMQLMPATAQDITNNQIVTNDLYNPEINIYLGNLYYNVLKNSFNNLDIYAIAAYNGGIGSVKRWKKNLIYSDTDEFVEQIPYTETKEYVKKVLSSYWNYIRIYQ